MRYPGIFDEIMNSTKSLARIKSGLFFLCLIPSLEFFRVLISSTPSASSVEHLQRWTGSWAFNLLLLTLMITPLRALTQQHWLIRLRRMLGLFSFFYASLHAATFFGIDHAFVADEIARDVLKRPFTVIGFAAYALLLALAVTSNQQAIRMLGGRRWMDLHRSIYPTAILAALHYLWLSKWADFAWPLAYALAVGLLLGWRVKTWQKKAIPVPRVAILKPMKYFRKPND